MSNFKYFEEIERYHRGEMEAVEKTAFEVRLAAEPELAAELADYQSMAGIFEKFGTENRAYVEQLLATEMPVFEETTIWDYHMERLPEAKAAKLEKQTKDNEHFSQLVQNEGVIIATLQEIGSGRAVVEEVEGQLRQEGFFKKTQDRQYLEAPVVPMPRTGAKVFRLGRKWLALAASLVVLAVAASVFFLQKPETDLVQATIAQQQKDLLTILGEDVGAGYTGSDDYIQKVWAHLKNGHPDAALAELQSATKGQVTLTAQAIYLYGFLFFERRDFAASLQQWELLEDPLPTMQPHVLWMMAVCYAETGRPVLAQQTLAALRNDAQYQIHHFYENEIRQLEKRLD